jgi:hypothetical protein
MVLEIGSLLSIWGNGQARLEERHVLGEQDNF